MKTANSRPEYVMLDFCARTPLVEKRRWMERCIWKLLDAVKKPSPKILEANCTDGWDTEIFLQRGARVVSVCSSKEHLDFARRRAPDAEFHLTISDLESETFDAVWCMNAFASLELITDLSALLKPNGLLAFKSKNDAENEMQEARFKILESESSPEGFNLITTRKR